MSRASISRVGVDTGGTFTDFVVIRDGKVEVFKELSTPRQPDDAIMQGISRIGSSKVSEVIHGSTVATNALLERKGARTALLTTEGFEDVIVIGRQTRRELYNIFVTRPEPLVPGDLRFGVRERTLYDGSIELPLDCDRLAADLDQEVRNEENRVKIHDPDHSAYSIYARATASRRDNLRRSAEELRAHLAKAEKALFELGEASLDD